MLLLAITYLPLRKYTAKIVVTITYFFKVTHLFYLYTETEMLQKRNTKYNVDFHWYFSKVNLCSVLSNSTQFINTILSSVIVGFDCYEYCYLK